MRLIDADALKEEINSEIAQATKVGITVDADYLWSLLNYAIDNAETIIPFASVETQTMIEYERPQGKWKSEGYFVFCDYCGSSNGNNKTPFCPYCGAEMKGGAE